MDDATLREYKRLRAQGNGAKVSLDIARHYVKPTTLDWKVTFDRHLAIGRGTVDGFDIRAVVDYDDRTYDYDFTDTDTGIRNPQYRWDGPGSEAKFIALESGETVRGLAPYLRKQGMSKHVAWETARLSLQEEARTYFNNEIILVGATVTASTEGVDLGSTSFGFDLSDDHLEQDLDDAVMDAVSEAIYDARENLDKVIAAERTKLSALEALTTAG